MEQTNSCLKPKQEILNSWCDLIILRENYLQKVKRGGGTMGHKVGYFKNEQIRLMKIFEENL